MSEGMSVSIVAANGGYIVEFNELIRMMVDTSFKTDKGEKVKVVQHRSGQHRVAVRATVDDAMKLVGQLLLERMNARQKDAGVMAVITGTSLYDTSDDMAEKPMAQVSPSSPSYAQKA